MSRFHITPDETGFWQMSFEDDAGVLQLVSHQYNTPEHLIEDAHELVASGQFPDATVIVAPPSAGLGSLVTDAASEAATAGLPRRPYARPAPRKAV